MAKGNGIAKNNGLNLANSLASGIKGLARVFGVTPDPTFTPFKNQGITGDFQRAQWFDAPSQGYYGFSVEDVGSSTISGLPKFIQNIKSAFAAVGIGSREKFGDFVLPINPQEITQTEDFAVSLRPTQGGTVVNHSGNKYKTLTISGTTGVMPGRNDLGVLKDTGSVIGKADELPNRSGYEVFLHFRNWVRSYHEVKAGAGNEKLRMVFRNYKDWEFLYVEPIKFTMRRDAAKPLLYNYNIQFRVTGVLVIEKPIFEQIIAKISETSAAAINAYALLKKNQDATQSIIGTIGGIVQSYNNLKMAIRAADGRTPTAGDLNAKDLKKLSPRDMRIVLNVFGKKKSTSELSRPDVPVSAGDPQKAGEADQALANNPEALPTAVTAAVQASLDKETAIVETIGVEDLPKEVQDILGAKLLEVVQISKDDIVALKARIATVETQLGDALGLGDATTNQINGITTPLPTTPEALTDEKFATLKALNDMKKSIDAILASDTFFDTITTHFKKDTAISGAKSMEKYFSMPSAKGGIIQGPLPDNTTLEDIALSELGDSSRWTEIAEINHLKPPYILNSRINISYTIESAKYYNPAQILHLRISAWYLIPATPTPAGAWASKGNYLARYNGSDPAAALNWTFVYPEDGMNVKVESSGDVYAWDGSSWAILSVDATSLDGVLRPGDMIKIPATLSPVTTSSQGPRDNVYSNDLSPSERALLVDLLLTDTNDLYMTPAGDLGVAAGVANGAQAVIQKLLVEKGGFKKFPFLGTSLTIGQKMPTIASLREDVTASLLQDPRIRDVRNINIIQEDNTVNLTFDVYFYNISQAVPVNIPI